MSEQPLHTRLTCTTGNHYKEYVIDVVRDGNAWLVNFAYGRIGNALQTGTKTNSPVTYSMAMRVYNGLVSEKQDKGYVIDDASSNSRPNAMRDGIITTLRNAMEPTMQPPVKEKESTGLAPQLLTPITQEQAALYLSDSGWVMQQKYDGNRVFIVIGDGEVYGANRKGQKISLPMPVVNAMRALAKGSRGFVSVTLDGELIGEQYIAYDILKFNYIDFIESQMPYAERLDLLERFGKRSTSKAFRVTPTARTAKEKKDLFDRLKAINAEGCVFKLASAPYTPGRGPDQVKCKFWETCSCIILGYNSNKDSMDIGLLNESGKIERWGSVTMIGKERPKIGSIAEIKYLYAVDSLYQPVFIGERTDVDRKDCTIAQLKFKPGSPRAMANSTKPTPLRRAVRTMAEV
ncbi:MAG: hypothetical protein HZB51_34330 [Chloroflexi bacterium]|nr:hypothetical protein [Chloroflexota bacterium]